ncbi:MAG: hypothetical protein JO151_01015 [Verrucomicrobia bacterium]|nr:hypothetical protein [Verrucomicrobiota bacterium]
MNMSQISARREAKSVAARNHWIGEGRGVDARWLICTGLLIVAAGNFWMSQLNLDISSGQVVWPRVVMVAGLGFVFAPINVAAYLYIPRSLRDTGVLRSV